MVQLKLQSNLFQEVLSFSEGEPLGELLRSKSEEALNVRRASYRLKSLSDSKASVSLGGDPRSQVTNCSRLDHARHDGYYRHISQTINETYRVS